MGCTSKLLIVGLTLASSALLTENLFAAEMIRFFPEGSETIEQTDLGPPVSTATLDSLSGGQDISIDTIDILVNNMKLTAEMENNLLYSTATGINAVSDGAFSSANGISTVIQNSGNQVIINNALILNLQLQ